MTQRNTLLCLARAIAAHRGVTHFAISMQIFRKGDFFARLEDGRDCTTRTAQRAMSWFHENWPDGLEWPDHIPRPDDEAREVA